MKKLTNSILLLKDGLVPIADSLVQMVPMVKTVKIVAIVLQMSPEFSAIK